MKSVGESTHPNICADLWNLWENIDIPTESTEFTEPAAEESLPQIAQIYTDSLGAEDSSGGILASAAAKWLPQMARMHPLKTA